MVVASTLRGGARGGSTGSRHVVIRDQLESLLLPASKAYLLGYIMDVLPAILKALIKFVTAELARIRKSEKRLREERSLASETSSKPRKRNQLVESVKPILSSLHRLPLLLKAIGKALLVALGMRGMAISCFLAMAGWRISEVLVWWPLAKYYALKLTSGAEDAKAVKSALTYARVTSTFVASALSSAGAMMMLQHQSASTLRKKQSETSGAAGKELLQIDTTPGWIPRSLRPSNFGFLGRRMAGERQQPRFASLAPAGHFLSRLTSLTVPGTPGLVAPGGGSPGLVPGSPESRGGALPVSPTAGTTLQPPEAGDAPPASPVLASSAPQLQVSEVDAKPRSTALGRPSPTIDLTLFALVRGLDTLVRALASTPTTAALKKSTTTTANSPTLVTRLASSIATQADGFIFVICCAQIMWAWFYHPERLPPTYVKWITNLATMDERLLLALRCIRHGKPLTWNYQSKEMTAEGVHLLGSLAEELGHPYQWGDPTRLPDTREEAKRMLEQARKDGGGEGEYVMHGAAGKRGRGEMGGMPCELVHCGTGGANCYKNALYRWIRGFRMSMAIYFPVHLLPRLLFNPRGFFRQPLPALLKVLTGAARSAAFLATYIVGNWFPICLARSALLPRLFPNVPFNFWDAGIGPALGSVACGFSIFIEERRKRAEMALYVAPRALFAMVEGAKKGWLSEGERTALWAERAAFGASVGVVVCAARYRPDLLRGITGAMGWVARSKGEGRVRRSYARDAA